MAFNRDFEINEAQVADLLQNATNKVRTTEDVDILTDLNKLFKKNVPLTVRKYVIAYLLKDALKHYHSFGNNTRKERNDRSDKKDRNKNDFKAAKIEKSVEKSVDAAEQEERPRHPRVEIPEAEATSIFVSIGKNRRVYPRDLVGLLIAVGGIDRERIGDIKVLANYSFVQLYTSDAQTAIDKLNGYDYRGRKLAVSYSRQKSEEETAETTDDVQPEIDSGYVSSETITEQAMAEEDAAAYAAAEKAAADKEPFAGV